MRFSFDGSLQLKLICVKNNIRLPLFVHITLVPECGELCSKWLKRFNIQEGRTFWHLPGNKGDEDQELAKVKLVALILFFTTIKFQLIN
jgi:hypothetical protein